jgi:rhamnogalacturonyl hydrolase YesR
MQPPSKKGAVVQTDKPYPAIGLKPVRDVDARIAAMTNWLIIGPFENPQSGGKFNGLDVSYAPEQELRFGVMYAGTEAPVTWTIPKIEVVGNFIDPLPWGTNYNWNYHNGGVAWAMQCLSEASGERKYADYAAGFCAFQLGCIPFVRHQVEGLNAFQSANHLLINTPLLDFTLAPSLPFIYRLRTESDFPNRNEYEDFIKKMTRYAKDGQIRLPGVHIYTRTTPVEYTTWVDDMFMGIPYLVQAALYTDDPADKKALLDDAANQVIGFNTQVWDETANLYMHARYFGDDAKFPHWSRANGWGIWAITEVLSVLPKNHPKYKTILNHYRKHVASLAKHQDPSGFWCNVLDRPDSRKEVSGTAIFTMAIARGVNNGWLSDKTYRPVAMKGWEAMKTKIKPDGTVYDICYGTMCTQDVNYYMERPFYDNDTHGLFAVLFAGIEVHRMMK